jgi:tol-pal system protein YbgF
VSAAGRLPRRALALGALLGTQLTTGCLASRQDVAMLQNDLRVMRTEALMADSAHRLELARISATMRSLQDTLATLRSGEAKFRGDVLGNLYSLNQQVLQVQELTGQSQRRLQDLRAEMEARQQQTMTPPPADTMTAASPGGPAPMPGAPGPNQLYQLALRQLQSGAVGTARTGFQELLRQYPTSDLAGDAQYYIAESYAREGKAASADSSYAIVYTKYPRARLAASALYKHALSLQGAGKAQQAREMLDRVVKQYPTSDEAMLARDRLRTPR